MFPLKKKKKQIHSINCLKISRNSVRCSYLDHTVYYGRRIIGIYIILYYYYNNVRVYYNIRQDADMTDRGPYACRGAIFIALVLINAKQRSETRGRETIWGEGWGG